MAIKPTIYKFRIALTDLNRDIYDSLSLTVAKHPSENNLRMMARVLAYCLNTEYPLQFTKGLSTIEEPDIWAKELDDSISLWIDVGEPDPDRVLKSSKQAKQVKVYSFNSKSDNWWQKNKDKLARTKASIIQFDADGIENVANIVERRMDISVMLSEQSIYVGTDTGSHQVDWKFLHSHE